MEIITYRLYLAILKDDRTRYKRLKERIEGSYGLDVFIEIQREALKFIKQQHYCVSLDYLENPRNDFDFIRIAYNTYGDKISTMSKRELIFLGKKLLKDEA